MFKIIALIGLFIYFVFLMIAVTKEKKNENVQDYFFGGRNLPFWALSITFIASWWGAGSAISSADLAYDEGLGAFCYYGLPVLISTLLMLIFAKMVRRVGLYTQSSMMEARYGKMCAKILAWLILIFMIFNAASQMVGIGNFFGQYLGIDYRLAICLGTGIVLIYSMFGGFKGVVLTDIIQFVLLLLAALIIFGVVLVNNDPNHFLDIVNTKRNTDYLSMFAGIKKYLVYIITFGLAWMIQANVWQRISATKNDKDAFKMIGMSFIIYIPLYLLVVLTGMGAISLFPHLPKGGVIAGVVLKYMNPILGAFVFVGISAAIMSTMDSLINTAAMTLSLDICKDKIPEKKQVKFSSLATLLVTIIALIIATNIRSILKVSWLASDLITTGAFIPLIFGFIFKKGTSEAALATMFWGLIYCGYNFLITIGLPLPHFYEIQSAAQILFGLLVALIVYLVISFMTTNPDKEKQATTFIHQALGRKTAYSKND